MTQDLIEHGVSSFALIFLLHGPVHLSQCLESLNHMITPTQKPRVRQDPYATWHAPEVAESKPYFVLLNSMLSSLADLMAERSTCGKHDKLSSGM